MQPSTGEPELLVLPDPQALAEEAADRVLALLGQATESRGEAHVALTGGSTAGGLYARLATPPRRDAIDWGRVHLWWGDERYVPLDHPDSNTRLALDILLGVAAHHSGTGTGALGTDIDAGELPGVRVPMDQVHPVETAEAIREQKGPEWAAADYAVKLEHGLPHRNDDAPSFDLVLLGVGPDGHILSVFPGSAALAPDAPLAVDVPAPEHVTPRVARITVNPRLVAAAERVLVMVTGAGKADVAAEVLRAPRDIGRLPAQLARRHGALWLLDRAAASRLG